MKTTEHYNSLLASLEYSERVAQACFADASASKHHGIARFFFYEACERRKMVEDIMNHLAQEEERVLFSALAVPNAEYPDCQAAIAALAQADKSALQVLAKVAEASSMAGENTFFLMKLKHKLEKEHDEVMQVWKMYEGVEDGEKYRTLDFHLMDKYTKDC